MNTTSTTVPNVGQVRWPRGVVARYEEWIDDEGLRLIFAFLCGVALTIHVFG